MGGSDVISLKESARNNMLDIRRVIVRWNECVGRWLSFYYIFCRNWLSKCYDQMVKSVSVEWVGCQNRIVLETKLGSISRDIFSWYDEN